MMLEQIINRFPGVSCAYMDESGKVTTECYRVSDKEKNIKVVDNTIFPACSMSKFVTAICLMKLHEENLIDIDSSVNRYLQQWKLLTTEGKESNATIRALMCHTSGILDGEDAFCGLRRGTLEISLLDILDGKTSYNNRPAREEKTPGTVFEYSDAGYCVLQLLVQEVTNKNFEDAVQKIIFDKLHLQNTFFASPENLAYYENNKTMATGYDENCLDYIKTYTDSVAPSQSQKIDTKNTDSQNQNNDSQEKAPSLLYQLIIKGYVDQAEKAAEALLKTTKPVDIVEKHIVPALDIVGKEYEGGKKFLPQLLLSADTVAKAFTVIKKHLAETGETQETKGKVIMATVEGDIHDIGKNIVCAMLENYGYEVIDLGKDVKPETIIETAKKEKVSVIGLSALMTTTGLSMENTIQKLRAAATPDKKYKIIVGGAVLTEEHAATIGADKYAADAMEAVRYAERVEAEIK